MPCGTPSDCPRRGTSGILVALRTAFLIVCVGAAPVSADAALASSAASTTAPADPVAESPGKASSLSVAPLVLPAYPDDRPAWVDQPPVLEGDEHVWPVASVPALTETQSWESLAGQKRLAVSAYIQHLTGSTVASGQLGFDADWIDAHLVDHDHVYSGTVITSEGTMHEHAVQLRLDEDFRQMVQLRYSELQVRRRLEALGLWGAGGLSMLLVLTGLLRVAQRRAAVPPLTRQMPDVSDRQTARASDRQTARASDALARRRDVQPRSSRRSSAAVILAGAIMLGTIPAAAAALWDIESISVSGAALVLASSVLLILARRPPLRMLMLIAVPTLLFAAGCFLTIFGMQWSPRQAHMPIGSASVMFASLIQACWPIVRIVRRESQPAKGTRDAAASPEFAAPLSYAATSFE